MRIIGKIVGINLAILALYCIGVSFIVGYEGTQVFFLGLIFIPIHLVTCSIRAFDIYVNSDEKSIEEKMRVRAYLLSALVVLIVGSSFCMSKIIE